MRQGPLATLAVAAASALVLATAHAQSSGASVVISQVYGGGGNTGATLRNDFIELFNRGNAPVSISGWSVQYASASGSSWDRTILSGTIQPGQYYLIQEAEGSGGSSSLPSPDAAGSINLSATSGKVALVSNSNVLSGATPSGAHIVDSVGYGTANAAEGSPTGELSNTTAALRRSGGCTDTNNNRADFTIGSPTPRNSKSPLGPCSPVAPVAAPQISAAGVVNAASFKGGPVAPGEILTVFGSDLGPGELVTLQLTPDRRWVTTSLAGTRILFDGVAAPMIYTSQKQASLVVPYSVAGRTTSEVAVEYEGRTSTRIALPVAPSAPGIFTLASSGFGQGAILNQDYSVNGPSNPARTGSVVIIYATGGGQTTPAGEDGKVVTELATQVLPVSARIGGVDAEVIYAGAAPGLVSGVLQVNAKVPDGLDAGSAVPLVLTMGSAASQPGVTLAVGSAPARQDGTGPLIEERLQQLRREATVPALPEIPHDQIGIPANWLALISWNIQVGGTSTAPGADRPPMVKAALASMFSGTYQILAAQEIPNAESADLLRTLLPGGVSTWQASFSDTTDSMDNGYWYRTGITLRDAFPLFVSGQEDAGGRFVPDTTRTTHPPVVAQFEAGNFDFTLINLHLTFADGDTSESVRELRHVLDYLDWYFNQPEHDPDVLVCGDFNIPSALSGQTGRGGITLDSVFDRDPRFQSGERRFVVTVHQPTSRSSAASGGGPASNYDHCMLSADTMEEFVQARRIDTSILANHPEDPEARLTSDHFPVVAFFKTRGEGVSLDARKTIRPSVAPARELHDD